MYALGADRVVRIARPGAAYRAERYDLVSEIAECGLPWPSPVLVDRGAIDGVHYAVESRIPGRSLDVVLQEVDGDARERALANYAEAALRVRESRVVRPWFGELYHDPPVRRPTWPQYLAKRARLQIGKAGAPFAAEVPRLREVMKRFVEDVGAVANVESGLVHGDFFPGNVLVDADFEVTGVVDFGWSTIIGDPRLDAVCASAFLEVDRPWCSADDAVFVRRYVVSRDPSLQDVFALYRTFCALHFSFVIHYGIPLSRWCVAALNEEA